MGIFYDKGNLADAPSLKRIKGRNGEVDVAKMRVFFGRYGQDEQGEIEQRGGFWREVEIYGEKPKACHEHLRKGARVAVMGREVEFEAHDDNNQPVEVYKIVAEDVTLVLTRVDKVTFKAPREQSEPSTRREPAYQ